MDPSPFPTELMVHRVVSWSSINFNVLLFKVQSHHGNGVRTLLDNNINTLIKQSDTDKTELTEIVGGKLQQELT